MRFRIATPVPANVRSVFGGFDEELFRKVKPPLVGLKVLRFDGCRAGDEVHLELTVLGVKQLWISRVTESQETPDEIRFTDRGVRLPAFLSFWNHDHRIVRNDPGATIIDEVTYKTPFPPLDWLLFPILYTQFYARKSRYRAHFGVGANG